MRSWPIVVLAAVTAIAVLLFKFDEWQYVQDGYHLKVGLVGGPFTNYAEHFPPWRTVAIYAIVSILIAGIGLTIVGRRLALVVLGLASAATVLVGAADVIQYGTIGSPTSLKSVGLTLLLFMTAQYMKKVGYLR